MTRLRRTLLVTGLALSVVGLGCDRPSEDKVPAIDLDTGETATFFEEDLPDGWVTCSDPSCRAVSEDIPCLNRTAALCEQDDACRSQLLSCSTKEEFELAAACGQDPAGEGCPAGPVPGCEYACVEIDRCPDVQLTEAERCPAGSAVPTYDPSGCLTGFRCTAECPEVQQPACVSGNAPSALTDPRSGCVIGFECDSVVKSADRSWDSELTLTPVPAGTGATAFAIDQCDSLSVTYERTLAEAKSCQPPADGTAVRSTCTTTVPISLKCGCPTYVNAAQTAAYEQLQSLRRRWLELGCDQSTYCGRVACDTPKGATCVTLSSDPIVGSGDTLSGTCQDM